MLKRGTLAVSAAVIVSLNGLAFWPSNAWAQDAGPDTTTSGSSSESEVVIEGKKTTPQSVIPTATQTEDVITTKQLSEIPVTTDFIQALQYLPNVYVYEAGGNGLNGSNITIDGFDQTRLAFTLDGIPINDSDSYSFYSNEFAQNPDIGTIAVEEGAGSATNLGLTAFGGTVAIETLDPTTTSGVLVTGGAGSFGTYSEYVKLNSGQLLTDVAPTRFYGAYSHASSDGYFANSQTDYKDSVILKSITQVGPGKLTLFFTQNSQEYNYYDGCTASQIAAVGNTCNENGEDPTKTSYTGYNLNIYLDNLSYADYSWNIGSVKLDAKGFFYYGHGFGGGGYSISSHSTTDPTQYLGEVVPERSWNDTNRPGGIITAVIPIIDAVTLKAGVLYQHSETLHYEGKYDPLTLNPIPNPAYPDPAKVPAPLPYDEVYNELVMTETTNPYVDLQIQPVQQLIIDAGAKYLDVIRHYTDDIAGVNNGGVHFDEALPSIGANYEFVPGYHFYANYTENARPPGYNQFYTGTFNQDLTLEKADTVQGGFYVRSGALEGRISGQHTTYQNYILSLQVQQPGTSQFVSEVVNAGDAVYDSGSLALTYQFNSWLSGFLNAGVVHTYLDEYHGPASDSPLQTESAGLEVELGGFSGNVAAEHQGPRFSNYLDAFDGTNTFSFYELPSVTTLNASLAYKWDGHPLGVASFKSIEARLIFTNITNQQPPVTASAGSPNFTLTDPASTYLTLMEPFSVFATVSLAL